MGKDFIKTFGAAMAFCVLAAFLAGCSERAVDYGMESDTADTESRDKRTGLKQFADVPAWREEWTAVNSKGNNVTVQVEADVRLPNTDQMAVIEVKETEFDAAFRKRIAESLFDGGDVFYYDPSHLPKEDLAAKRAELQEEYDSCDPEDPEQKENIEVVMGELQEYDRLMETAGDSYVPAESYDVGSYLGERAGNAYILDMYEIKNDAQASMWKSIRMYPKEDLRQFCPEEFQDVESLDCFPSSELEVNNQCKMTEEDAKKLADELVGKLDLGYTKCRYSRPLAWDNMEYYIYDGYVFRYDAGMDDVSFLESGTLDDYLFYSGKKKESEFDWYGTEAWLNIYVNDKGIVQIWAENPIEIVSVTENVALLSLDQIRSLIKKSVTENFGSFRFDYTAEDYLVTFNEMALIYFRIRDRENAGHYSYVPAWRLAHVIRDDALDELTITNFVLINAIDGSVINMYDEV